MAQTVAELEAKLTLNLEEFRAQLDRLDGMMTHATAAVSRHADAFKGLEPSIGSVVARIGELTTAFTGAQLGMRGLEQLINAAKEAIFGFNATLEQAQLSFTFLVGGADAARQHIEGLMQMARSTPFPVDQFLQASRILQGMGMNAAFVPGVLKQISDAAAAMGVPLDQAAQAIGRFLSIVAGGTAGVGGIGQGARALMSMGLISGPFLAEIRNMEAAGKSADQIIQRFLEELGRFKGASAEAANTWSGLMVRIREELTITAAQGFRPIFDRLEQMHKSFVETFAFESIAESLNRFSKGVISVFDLIATKTAGVRKALSDFDAATRALLSGIPGLGWLAPPGAGDRSVLAGEPKGYGVPGPAPPRGSMYEKVPPTAQNIQALAQQMQALEQARRILADLNPTLDTADKKVLELATRFGEFAVRAQELANTAGPLAGRIKELAAEIQTIGVEAGQAALFFGQMEVWTKVTDDFQKSMPVLAENETKIKEVSDRYEKWSTQVLPALRANVLKLGEAIVTSMKNKVMIDDMTKSWEEADRAAKDYQGLVEALRAPFLAADEAARQFTRTLATIPQFAAIMRGAGVPGMDVTGAQQSAIQARIQTLLTQIADWNEQLSHITDTAEDFKLMTAAVEKAALEVDVLKTKLASLQEINTLKGMFSDVFSAMDRAVSTMVTGIIQGTTTAKDAFNNLGQSILLSINEMIIKRAFKSLEEAFNSMLDSMDTRAVVSGALRFIAGLFGAAPSAAPASSPPVWNEPTAMQSGGVVTSPRRVLVGEAGPEAVIPLDSAAAHQYLGGGSAMVQVTVINNAAGTETQTKESTGPMGERQIEIMINGVVKKDIAQGGYDRLLQTTFGVTRQGINR